LTSSGDKLRGQLDDMKTKVDNVFAYVDEMHQGEDDLLRRYCFQKGKTLELKEELAKVCEELDKQCPLVVKKMPRAKGGLTYPSFVCFF
jgi:hypothetical protein